MGPACNAKGVKMKNNVSVAGKGSEEPQILSAPKMMIESRIKQIRGMQVLLTRDLAELYQVEPRAINQAVKRNKERFPQKYCFQLNSEEFDSLKSQIVISSWGGARIAPYAFTEQGVAMLSAVLKSDRAVRVSIEIMDAFVKMRHYLVENRDILDLKKTDYALLSMQTIQNTSKIADIEHNVGSLSRSVENVHGELQKVMEFFHDPSTFKHFLILNGQKLEADVAYTQIYGMAQKTIFVFDDYVGVKTLDLLRGIAQNVQVTIFTDQRGGCALTDSMLADFKAARPDAHIERKPAGGKFHDRYIVLDYGTDCEKMFHCGASSKDAGGRITTIMEIENPEVYREVIEGLL